MGCLGCEERALRSIKGQQVCPASPVVTHRTASPACLPALHSVHPSNAALQEVMNTVPNAHGTFMAQAIQTCQVRLLWPLGGR